MRLVKLTDTDGYTRRGAIGETLWVPGEHPPTLSGTKLCRAGIYHAYRTPEQAVYMDPAHAHLLPSGRAWWAEGGIVVDDGIKVGCHDLMIIEPCELPVLSHDVRIRIAIYVAQLVRPHNSAPEWDRWAKRWLSGEDRTARAAAAAAARARADAEAWAVAARADAAAAAATNAANAAAANAANAANAADAAADAVAAAAARAAAAEPIDLIGCLTRAIENEAT